MFADDVLGVTLDAPNASGEECLTSRWGDMARTCSALDRRRKPSSDKDDMEDFLDGRFNCELNCNIYK